ncbi:hypothetical protein ACFM35_00020 [Microbacterium sp. P01]|uniref:hypothetical protein n=1 Tax=Microbacterium sp. P01 TaxID=3366261 RepID=UPI00366C8955
MDDEAELSSLRGRAFGPAADIADDPEALARLEQLEQAARTDAPAIKNGAMGVLTAGETFVAQPAPTVSVEPKTDAPVAGRRDRSWWWVWAALICVVCLAVGIAVGWLIPRHTSPTGLPAELLLPATDEDRISVDVGPPVEPGGRIRYIATFEGYSIYLATNEDQSLLCVLTFLDRADLSTTCMSWAADSNEPGAYGITGDLTIVVGDVAASNVSGERVKLSQSVTAVKGSISP